MTTRDSDEPKDDEAGVARAEDLELALATAPRPLTPTELGELLQTAGVPSVELGKRWSGRMVSDWLVRVATTSVLVRRSVGGAIQTVIVDPRRGAEILLRAHAVGRLARFAEASRRVFPTQNRPSYAVFGSASPETLRDLRLALASSDAPAVVSAIEALPKDAYRLEESGVALVEGLSHAPPASWIEALPPMVREHGRMAAASLLVGSLGPASSAWLHGPPPMPSVVHVARATLLATSGALTEARDALASVDASPEAMATRCFVALLEGDFVRCAEVGHAATSGAKKKRTEFAQCTNAAAFVVGCLASGRPLDAERARAFLDAVAAASGRVASSVAAMHVVVRALDGAEPRGADRLRYLLHDQRELLTIFYHALAHAFLDVDDRDGSLAALVARLRGVAERNAHRRLVEEIDGIRLRLARGGPGEGEALAERVVRRAGWAVALDRLEAGIEELLTHDPTPAKKPARAKAETVLGYVLHVGEYGVSIQPTTLVRHGRVGSAKPEPVAKWLKSDSPLVTDHDRKVLAHARAARDERTGRSGFELRHEALLALVGHPHVVDLAGVPMEVVEAEPRLVVEPGGRRGTVVRASPRTVRDGIGYELVDGYRVEVAKVDASFATLAAATGAQGLAVPPEGRERLDAMVGRVGARLRIDGLAGASAAAVDVDRRLHVQLVRESPATFRARLRLLPFGVSGPALAPGAGATTVVGEREGRPVRAVRDLVAERRALDAFLVLDESFAHFGRDDVESAVLGLEETLALLLALAPHREAHPLHWPDGKPLPAPTSAGRAPMKLVARSAKDWLGLDGGVEVDDGSVIDMRTLLDARASMRGRFVELPGERFVALTEGLRRTIDALARTVDLEAKQPRIHPLVLHALEGGLSAEVTAEPRAAARLDALRAAMASTVRMPRSFGAELRDYQREGVAWMARLAEAGTGGVLADDMGLGKTVQTLALLALRRARGPALVVAPTSVVAGWADQARRFAPSLRIQLLAASDRGAALRALGPGDVLVASYGLLVSEAEGLAGVRFATAVFDEAQALKNASTQRAAAARRIDADARFALSGTPVENHLGELWALLDLVVPGLLGTERAFERRFGAPIRAGERAALPLLRTLLRPFLLRRTKAQVLDELPERTELVRTIEPGPEERAFYEALRRKALDELARDDVDGEATRFRILAALQTLRRAATDPRLVEPDAPPGAKLTELVELLVDLRAGGHRTLVFGQHLEALAQLRAVLDERGITHLSLEGATAAKERARRVAAFQEGEADVFVISLKAGGTGLNLTGADAVVLMDPWWNPAVEDQAADRAHRIGQTRAVTVFRLVTAGTVEERMLALHGEKRALAADVLEGFATAKKLDLGVLRSLL